MTETDRTDPIPGVHVAPVTAWFEANVAGVVPPLTFDLIAGGRSNLTFRVDDAAGASWVLRRPPAMRSKVSGGTTPATLASNHAVTGATCTPGIGSVRSVSVMD